MINPHRLQKTTPELEAQEKAWWAEYAAIEDQFCWVQRKREQQLLRSSYVKRIVNFANPSRPIIDLGCGTGWLSILLAENGASEVVGVDFSEAQIQRANEQLARSPARQQVRFVCDSGSGQDHCLLANAGTVVMHGFLHHLSVHEIQVLFKHLATVLPKDCKILIFEPSIDPALSTSKRDLILTRLLFSPIILLAWLRKRFLPFSQPEKEVRTSISKRQRGTPPRGVSPKEIAFYPGELESYLAPYFRIEDTLAVMAFSHCYAAEMILLEMTSRNTAHLLYFPFVYLGIALERLYLKIFGISGHTWIFKMWTIVHLGASGLTQHNGRNS